ncbi:hypothetical protein FGG08_004527 [Glutinoglossum americanum]|uniref:ABC transporter domain-containing protein n=1 Tax=Glutinoglossum americanum TaxID=1670608 RepID=A0A9P8L2F6_9PEZI|nr:hypothetical protein FGG08_004527 [Glutinoglossum americanum]
MTSSGTLTTQTSNSGEMSRTVLQCVIESDVSRNEVLREIDSLSCSPANQAKRLLAELAEAEKNASLRSGSRGLQARKALRVLDGRVAEAARLLDEPDNEISEGTAQQETREAVDLLSELQSQFEQMTPLASLTSQARNILSGLGFSPATMDAPFTTLSGGWQMRCCLAGVLLQPTALLILDEPTNFLDLLGIIWLQHHLLALIAAPNPPTVLLVSHDRSFLDTLCTSLLILRNRTLTYFAGNLSAYEADQRDQKLYLSRMKEAQDRQIAHMEKTIREGIKLGKKTGDDGKLRMAKSRQKKVDERMGMEVGKGGGRFKLNRDLQGFHLTNRASIEVPQDERPITFALPPAPTLRFPGPLISLENIAYAHPGRSTPVLQGVTLTIHPGDRVGILGLNGCGKSTLLGVLGGKVVVAGVERHARLRVGWYEQSAVEELKRIGEADPSLTALQELQTHDPALTPQDARSLLSSLGLRGSTVSDTPLSRLSGGQLVRVALAKVLWPMPHLLLLDEVTTHLDAESIGALVEALREFEGAVVVVSHDRWAVRGVVEEMDGDEGEEEGRRRVVFELVKGGLRVLEEGVWGYERRLERRLGGLLKASLGG